MVILFCSGGGKRIFYRLAGYCLFFFFFFFLSSYFSPSNDDGKLAIFHHTACPNNFPSQLGATSFRCPFFLLFLFFSLPSSFQLFVSPSPSLHLKDKYFDWYRFHRSIAFPLVDELLRVGGWGPMSKHRRGERRRKKEEEEEALCAQWSTSRNDDAPPIGILLQKNETKYFQISSKPWGNSINGEQRELSRDSSRFLPFFSSTKHRRVSSSQRRPIDIPSCYALLLPRRIHHLRHRDRGELVYQGTD